MVLKRIDTIVFDFGNVLFDLDIPRWQRAMERILAYPPILDWSKVPTYSTFIAYETGKITEEEFVYILQQLAPDFWEYGEIIQAWNSIFIGMQKSTLELLANLKEEYRLYLLSNINHTHYRFALDYIRDHLGEPNWSSYFDRCFYSHRIGLRKPDEEVYIYLIEQAKLNPTTTLFIDDLKENVFAAESLGIVGLLKKPQRGIVELLRDYKIIV